MDEEPTRKDLILKAEDYWTNDQCKRCGNETNTISHYEKCERDNEMLQKAKKWIEYMDKQDYLIDQYIQLQDDMIDVPDTYVLDHLFA